MKKTILVICVLCLLTVFSACQKPCEHTYIEESTLSATCTAPGTKTYTCTLCNDSYTEEIPMIEHSFGAAKVTKEATCTAPGTKTHTCTMCNDSYAEEIPMIEHSFGAAKVTKEATCTEEGEKSVTCEACGVSVVSETIMKIDCIYTTVTQKQNTCIDDGMLIHTCSMCGSIKEEKTKATGHNWESATCTQAKHCTTCNLNEGVELGHAWQEATCTSAKRCERCGQVNGAELGHNWDDGTIIIEATYTSQGEIVFKCYRCNQKKTEYTDILPTTVALPDIPVTVIRGSNSASIAGLSYSATWLFTNEMNITVNYTIEKLTGTGSVGFLFKLYDEEGYCVDTTRSVFSGAPGEKEKKSMNFFVPKGKYTLVIESD